MKLHRRNYLPLALAVTSMLAMLWIWQMTLPLLDEQTQALHNHHAELQQRQQAAAAQIYQPLVDKLQAPVPTPATIIAAIRKTGTALDLADTGYTLSQPSALEANKTITTRRLSITLPKVDPTTALAFWQDLRQAMPCEVRLSSFTSESATARLELELLGNGS